MNASAPTQAPFDAGEAADHRDDEKVDRRLETDVPWRDLPLPPHEQHSGERREEGGEAEGERAMQRDGVSERAHANGLVSETLQRQPERRTDQ